MTDTSNTHPGTTRTYSTFCLILSMHLFKSIGVLVTEFPINNLTVVVLDLEKKGSISGKRS